MNVLIVGCGRVGTQLAKQLSQKGHDVSVVDADEERLEQLGDGFEGMVVQGVAMDLDVLREAGIEGCDAMAVVSQDDNLNITVAQIAKEFFGVDRIIARVSDPEREDVFERFGLSTVCPTKVAAETVYDALVENITERLVTFDTCTIASTLEPIAPELVGKSVREVSLLKAECLFGVQHADARITLYDGRQDIVLKQGDRLLLNRVVD